MRRRTAELLLPSGTAGREVAVAADWWFPESDPVALVWLQHGFSRRPEHLAGLAAALAAGCSVVVVAPRISSAFMTSSGYWINGEPMHDAIAQLFGEHRRRLDVSATAAAGSARRVELPETFVLAGHSAGGNLAAGVAGRLTGIEHADRRAVDTLKGVVMLDGVDRGGVVGRALEVLVGTDDRPVWTIAAPGSWCNARGHCTAVLQRARPARFVGVRLAGGSHIDAEGPDSGRAARLVCRAPRPENVQAVRTLAVDWITHLVAGSPDDALLARTAAGTTTSVGGAQATTL